MPIVQKQISSAKPRPGQLIESLRLSPPIEQLDVTTVWSNLSIGIAELLFEMNRVIGPCLESMLATQLEELDVAARKEYSPFKGNLSGDLNDTRPVLFSLGGLIDGMLEKMQFHCYHHMSLHSPNVLMELMMLYLISLNNIDEFDGPATEDAVIHVGLRPGEDIRSEIVPPPTAHVVQQLDYLSFPGLDVMPREGTTIKIIPQYSRGVFNKTNDSYSEVSYIMESKPSWLDWDEEISGWKGNLPLYSEWRGKPKNSEEVISGGRVGPHAVVNLLRLEVKALLIERHSSSSVRLKRTVRARLTLKVIPWYAHENSHAPHGHPQPKRAKIAKDNENWISPAQFLPSKTDLSPAGPRKYIGEHFDLGSDKTVFDAVSQRDLQVYHISSTSLDRLPPPSHHPHLENFHRRQPRRAVSPGDYVPPQPEERGTWSTGRAARVYRHASSRTSRSLDSSQRIPSLRNREDRSRIDNGLNDGNRDHLPAVNTMKRHRSDHFDEAYNELHWQDSEEFGSEFFDEHDRQERRQSLHNASPELFGLAEGLHETCAQTEEDSVTQGAEDEGLSPIQLSGLRDDGENNEVEAALSSNPTYSRKGMLRSDAKQDRPPRFTFYLNRYSTLRELEEQDINEDHHREQLPTPESGHMGSTNNWREDSGYGTDSTISHGHPEQAVAETLGNRDFRDAKILDSLAGDAQIRREQELLWDLLTNREANEDRDRQRGTRDRKLEAEEKKGLWEVLKWEARQKQRKGISEETLGMESGYEGEDFSSGGEPEESSFHYEGDDQEIQGSWNFGC